MIHKSEIIITLGGGKISMNPYFFKADIRHHEQIKKWIAAQRGDFSFTSPHLLEQGVPNNDGYNPRVHASILEAVIRQRAGVNPQTEWFYRGDTDPVEHSSTASQDTSPDYPELPIALTGYDEEDEPLIIDYITWKAPQLLMLSGISPDWRARLEELAVRQTQLVERFYLLYPEIHNKDLLNRARIEAKIRSANTHMNL
jgi:hypothetical protein